jgi:RNA polymerase sigma-70 factor (ECF subfamily)
MKQYGDQDDANLVASVLAGEREAFDMLLQRYSSSVLHLCTRLLGNTFEAQDIAQEAALQAFLGLSRLREPARFAAWFHAIAANLARMALRHRRELPLHTLSDEGMTQTFWIDSPPAPEEYQKEKEIRESILLALRNLSLVNRQAVIGFYLQGYSYEELAQLLDIPVSTVKGRLFQGRKQLKPLLRPLADTLLLPLRKRRKKMNASHFFAGDDPEHLPSWRLDIEERRIRVNHSGESESLHLLLQPHRIIRPQLKPRPPLRLLIRERILRKLHAQARTVGKCEGVNRFWRTQRIRTLNGLQTENAGKEVQKFLLRFGSGIQVN